MPWVPLSDEEEQILKEKQDKRTRMEEVGGKFVDMLNRGSSVPEYYVPTDIGEIRENFAEKARTAAVTIPDPDKFAADINLARRSGMPFGLLDDPEVRTAAEQAVKETEAFRGGLINSDEYARQYAKTRAWLERGNNLAISWDDVNRMYRSEGIIQSAYRGAKKGSLQTDLGQARYRQMFSGGGDERIAEIKAELERYEDVDTLPEKLAAGLGTTIGQQKEPIMRGLKYAFALGTVAAAAAAVTGTGGLAAPVAGVMLGAAAPTLGSWLTSAAFSSGSALGSVESMFQTEAGLARDALLDIRDENGEQLPGFIVNTGAILVGMANFVLEFAQLGFLVKNIPGLRRLVTREAIEKTVKNRSVRGILGRAAIDYGAALAGEIGTETLQEGVGIAVEEGAKSLAGETFKGATGEEIAARLGETIGESAFSFALAVLPGSAIGAYNARQAQNRQADDAVKGAELLGITVEATKDFKIVQRDSATARDYIGTLLEGQSFFYDPKTIQTLYQE